MSYIDCFKHEVLSENLIGIPLYIALEDIDGGEFLAKKGQLILGGGGGEHPAVVIDDINDSMQMYLYYEKELIDWKEYNRDIDFDNLIFYDWSILTFYNFVNIIKENGYIDGYPEHWMQFKVVEFILKNYPELIDNKWKELLK